VANRLLDDAALAASDVVANAAMNRSRQLAGVNSYTRELGFNPVEHLTTRVAQPRPEAGDGATVGWLDLCCGTGQALIQAADQLPMMSLTDQVAIVGWTWSTSSTRSRGRRRVWTSCARRCPAGYRTDGST
jgi:hypothetical protein